MLSQLLALAHLCLLWPLAVSAISPVRLAELRNATTQVFHHGWDNYMRIAFPEDELRPISCTPLTRDPANPGNYDLNDVLGNYSLTLIDSLSTLAILAGTPSDHNTAVWALQEFQQSVAAFVEYYGDGRQGPSGEGRRARGFDLDSKVQVFETVIRGVGGLLSAHLFAVGELPIPGYNPGHVLDEDEESDPLELHPISWPNGFKYDGQLLRLALDLAERLLPAFYTKTGLPYPRVNLRHGIPFYVNSPLHKVSRDDPDSPRTTNEKTDTCSAGAGSLVLEFTVLSRLTGDPRFEQLAKRAFWAVWKAKSEIGLIGNAIDPEKGEWVSFDSGIGAGVDSFFEYALKSHILLSGHELPNVTISEPPTDRQWLDPNTLHDTPLTPEENSAGAFLEAWHHAHAAIKRHLYNDAHHPYYMTGHRTRGYAFTSWIDSLAAFYPGLLAMAGEVEEAEEANLLYTALWTRYGALPERWSVRDRQVDSGIGWWPGRPEFIESNYYLYRATNDPWYVHVGEMVLSDIKRLCYTKCGWSGLQNVDTGEKADRMQSFFLGETTKYLYLLFDPDHPLNKLDAAYVFTTEAHPLIIPRRKTKPKKKQKSRQWAKGVNVYYDENFTNTCPAPVKQVPLTGSVLAARADVFHAASFVNLHTISNPRSGVEFVPAGKGSNGSISRYKANHTFFPWTLPRSLIPDNGTCAALPFKPTLIIEFPSSIQQGSVGSAFNNLFANTAAFKTPVGVRISALSGLKVHFVQEDTFDSAYDHTWRVTQVNHMPLGRDEPVHIDADLLNGISDPLFNRVRYNGFIELIMMHGEPEERNASAPVPAEGLEVEIGDLDDQVQLTEEARSELAEDQAAGKSMNTAYRSMLKSMIRAVTSVFDPTNTPAPRPAGTQAKFHVESYMGALAVGKGAVPLPDIPDASIPTDDVPPNLQWQTVYRAGFGCDGRLPDEAPRHHQVIVMRRGGCSFSEKIANIPSYTPSARSLQLVIVVDEDELENNYVFSAPDMWEYEMIKPHLDVEQITPAGLRRPHPIAMVMIRGGGPEAYEKFGNALGVGVRRKYFIETQGRRVDNIIVL
ncbi:ER degradation-enhancing alpha-mannosidase-like protein 1 [Colletotrichum spaethianum]|uniref:alpha-1,2-Mannosidase n=1 Tax=Colletotrichum spaethianum TaxID=700344 RepID=A0AA37LAY3_9PEZI|nr:ER degradation-enhancing alpha-mannosidase-like protein 1 [Colletotrichum spaethianum]GKT43230.1 ER degradation-enhancing alpha-mannosidase-like protein 1 [Colletotrichum spaethianum]